MTWKFGGAQFDWFGIVAQADKSWTGLAKGGKIIHTYIVLLAGILSLLVFVLRLV